MQTQFDALITAGYDRNKPDALALATGQPQKAMVELAGAPMLWHVVQALHESGLIGEIVIVGLDPDQTLDFGRPVHYVPDHGSMMANQKAGGDTLAALNKDNRYVLATSADIPLVTGEMIRSFIDACRPFEKDIYWGIVGRQVMETTFPNSKRSYLRLREGSFCSGDLFIFDLAAGLGVHERATPFFATRKSTFQQVRLLGFSTILRFLLGRLSLQDLLTLVEERFAVTVAPIQLPYAEVGMDVDKPHQLAQVEAYLAEHPDHPANTRFRPHDAA